MANATITVHAGHNPDGMVACGAVGLIKESTAARQITHALYNILDRRGYLVTDITVNDGKSQQDILNRLVENINAFEADVNISIHLNSFYDDSANGVESYSWNTKDDTITGRIAREALNRLATLGYNIHNGGIQSGTSLYIIRHTTVPVLLIECGYVTNAHDCELFDPEKIALKIADAIATEYPYDMEITTEEDITDPSIKNNELERVQVGAFAVHDNAVRLRDELIAKGYKDAFITKA